VLAGPDRLEAHKGDLHGQHQADDEEGTVSWEREERHTQCGVGNKMVGLYRGEHKHQSLDWKERKTIKKQNKTEAIKWAWASPFFIVSTSSPVRSDFSAEGKLAQQTYLQAIDFPPPYGRKLGLNRTEFKE